MTQLRKHSRVEGWGDSEGDLRWVIRRGLTEEQHVLQVDKMALAM